MLIYIFIIILFREIVSVQYFCKNNPNVIFNERKCCKISIHSKSIYIINECLKYNFYKNYYCMNNNYCIKEYMYLYCDHYSNEFKTIKFIKV